ncbi:GspH/FimT family pseudopilin [Pseudoalteromonas sp. MM17-2]|uniref:GspH/FimT family pseudopilin n=1 Tax=Pseudoalteromonas TaxID=53246 RepID=UPI0011093D7A|nr:MULTISPECIES: GspH/FimT family pseudopilin [Pseudoalteromonas]MCG7542969.1 GspH/FimT family pseudopilin [Pseudoalteromonas sp. MM17-2]TLX51011.1 pilus assembly protein [Pseudoalteromonas ruthenica]|tara:strand:+ start:119988 stop:120515 length:528 start_codon:yes stop_codon:yes gene_type:complete
MSNNTHRQAGFTLLELMVTVAIVAIVASIAFSNSTDMLARDRAENHLFELKRQLMFARAKATSTDATVVVCPLNGANCTNDWQSNTVAIFVDDDNNGQFGGNDTLLREMETVPANDTLVYSGNSPISFDATGRVGLNQNGDFAYCPNTGNDSERSLTLTQSGTTLYRGATTTGCS